MGKTLPQDKILQDRYVLVENINMTFYTKKGTFEALRNINLDIKEGEFVTIIGHSGCGKSTVLNLIAGLLEPTSGHLFCNGREIAGPGPDRGVVFQAPSLFPWLTAFENVTLGVDKVYPHATKSERNDIVEYYLTRVGLADSLH